MKSSYQNERAEVLCGKKANEHWTHKWIVHLFAVQKGVVLPRRRENSRFTFHKYNELNTTHSHETQLNYASIVRK